MKDVEEDVVVSSTDSGRRGDDAIDEEIVEVDGRAEEFGVGDEALRFFQLNLDDSGRKSLAMDSEEGTCAVAGIGDGVSVDMMNDDDVDGDVNDDVDSDVDGDVSRSASTGIGPDSPPEAVRLVGRGREGEVAQRASP